MQDNRLKGDESTGPAIAALVADLMFAARIRGADPKAATVQRAEALLDVVGPGTRLVLVDLHVPGAVEAISRLVGRGTGTDDGDGAGPGGDFREGSGVHPPRIVAFGAHVQGDLLRQAREAGADRVMARSAFVRRLSDLVAGESE